LTSFKVSVGSRSTSLSRLELVGVHTQTHGTTSFSPVEAGLLENDIQSFSLGLLLDETRSRDDHSVDVLGNLGGSIGLLSGENDSSGRSEIFDSTVGT
jgi:hypothetical protein